MEKNERMDQLWNYYAEIADETGRDHDGNMQGYSLSFFFGVPYEQIANDLTNAFFGRSRLEWNVDREMMTPEMIRPYFCTERELYPAQVTAILRALSDPVSLVQGPPGTGKTETILNLLSVIHGLYPEKTVAVVSSNYEAIRNITEQIEDPKAFNENLLELRARFAKLGSKSKRRKCEGLDAYICDEDQYLVDPSFLERFPVFSSTIHSLRKIFGNDFDQQFDYVIVDECSQISVMLGLIAMSCARQLVLVGDNEQIPPIITSQVKDITDNFAKNTVFFCVEEYTEKDGRSFLNACETAFEGKIRSTLLDHHYRCHPSIIGFCNEYVYRNSLTVKTKSRFDGEFRLRAVWYEGDYYEIIRRKKDEENTVTARDRRRMNLRELLKQPGKRNLRQLRIFMEEEWPGLREKVDRKLSICVLSPFRFQLELLQRMICDKLEEEKNEELQKELVLEGGLEEKAWNSEQLADIPRLTIHKAQGRGYDIVYMFTVEDCGNRNHWSWCQRKHILNVAVSRAKQEFCIITSAQWLPRDMKNGEKPEYLPSVLKPFKTEELEDEPNQLFYCKLMDYIDKNCPNPQGPFGLHKSKIVSVFDKVPQYREIYATGKNYGNASSAPSRCMRDALQEIFGSEYTILCEVPLKAIVQTEAAGCTDPEMLSYREQSRLDLVLCKGNEIHLILEIDGAIHRDPKNEKQRDCDTKKDRWIAELLHAGRRYVRIPTDGTTDSELERIQSVLDDPDAGVFLTLDDSTLEKIKRDTGVFQKKDRLVKDLKLTLKRSFDGLKKQTQGDAVPEEAEKILRRMNFRNLEKNVVPYEEELTRQFYLCRYGIAYAFEYALMYDIVLRSYMKEHSNERQLGTFSFGCGSMIDAWAMAYAKSRLCQKDSAYDNCRLYYKGVDAKLWGEYFVSLPQNDPDKKDNSPFANIRLTESDLNDYIERTFVQSRDRKVYHNILTFPKILNELDERNLKTMTEKLSKCNFNLDEYYLCVSHSRFDVRKGIENVQSETGIKAVQNMIHVMNADGSYEVCSDIEEMLGDAYDDFKKVWLGSGKEELIPICVPEELDEHRCYIFKGSLPQYASAGTENRSPAERIEKLNSDFRYPAIAEYMKELEGKLGDEKIRVNQITRVSQIIFQVIRLKKKKQEQTADGTRSES